MRVCAVVVWWCVALLHEENEDAAHEQVKGVEGLRVSQAGEHQRRGGGRGHAGRFQPAGRSGGDYARVKRPQTSHQADTWSAPSLGPASLRQRKRQRRRSSRPANHIGGSRSVGAPRFSVNSSRSRSVSLSLWLWNTSFLSPPARRAIHVSGPLLIDQHTQLEVGRIARAYRTGVPATDCATQCSFFQRSVQ